MKQFGEPKCYFSEMEASEEGYRFKTLLEEVLREVLKLFYLNILSEVSLKIQNGCSLNR